MASEGPPPPQPALSIHVSTSSPFAQAAAQRVLAQVEQNAMDLEARPILAYPALFGHTLHPS